jgi:hypothetical protein
MYSCISSVSKFCQLLVIVLLYLVVFYLSCVISLPSYACSRLCDKLNVIFFTSWLMHIWYRPHPTTAPAAWPRPRDLFVFLFSSYPHGCPSSCLRSLSNLLCLFEFARYPQWSQNDSYMIDLCIYMCRQASLHPYIHASMAVCIALMSCHNPTDAECIEFSTHALDGS